MSSLRSSPVTAGRTDRPSRRGGVKWTAGSTRNRSGLGRWIARVSRSRPRGRRRRIGLGGRIRGPGQDLCRFGHRRRGGVDHRKRKGQGDHRNQDEWLFHGTSPLPSIWQFQCRRQSPGKTTFESVAARRRCGTLPRLRSDTACPRGGATGNRGRVPWRREAPPLKHDVARSRDSPPRSDGISRGERLFTYPRLTRALFEGGFAAILARSDATSRPRRPRLPRVRRVLSATLAGRGAGHPRSSPIASRTWGFRGCRPAPSPRTGPTRSITTTW